MPDSFFSDRRIEVESAVAERYTVDVVLRSLDRELQTANATFAAYRVGDVSLAPPEVVAVPPGGFGEWMKSKGKAGGQHKLPRMDSTGQLTTELMAWFRSGPPGSR